MEMELTFLYKKCEGTIQKGKARRQGCDYMPVGNFWKRLVECTSFAEDEVSAMDTSDGQNGLTLPSEVCVCLDEIKKWMTEEHRMSPIIRDLSEATEGMDEGTGECVLKANINNMEFYNKLLLQCACQHFLLLQQFLEAFFISLMPELNFIQV